MATRPTLDDLVDRLTRGVDALQLRLAELEARYDEQLRELDELRVWKEQHDHA